MTTKQDTATVKLIYPAFKYGKPHVAEVTVPVRLTPKQIVALEEKHVNIVYVNGYTRGPTGLGPHKYWRRNGHEVGGLRRSWRLAPGELERLNANDKQAKAGKDD